MAMAIGTAIGAGTGIIITTIITITIIMAGVAAARRPGISKDRE